MEVRWPSAAKDLERIFRRVERDNPTAAHNVVKTIYDSCVSLQAFPIADAPAAWQDGAN